MDQQIEEITLIEFVPRTTITLVSKGKVIGLPINEIFRVSKSGIETLIHTTSETHKSYYSIQDILNELPVNEFFRIHKSHVIALRHMSGVRKTKIKVGEFFAPCTDYYKKEMISRLKELIDKRLNFYMKK